MATRNDDFTILKSDELMIGGYASIEIVDKQNDLITLNALNTAVKKFMDDKKFRNVKGYQVNFDTPRNEFYWNLIKKEIERLYVYYTIKFPKMSSNKINQIDLLKYRVGGKYEVHIDHFSTTTRCLSVIINLNDNYKGGNLVFTDQKEIEIKRIKLQKNSIVFFPSNFLYPHTIEPILKGTRYSIVEWLQ